MRTLSVSFMILAVLSLNSASARAMPEIGQKTKAKSAVVDKTVVGYISDSSCGLQHMAGMDDKDCTLMCAKNGKFVLADRDRKVVYQLDKTGQERAREFAGQKVKIRGRVTGRTIRVTAIEATT